MLGLSVTRLLRLRRQKADVAESQAHRIEDLSQEYKDKLKRVVKERNTTLLDELEKVDGIAEQLTTSLQEGIGSGAATDEELQGELRRRRETFGSNGILGKRNGQPKFLTTLRKAYQSHTTTDIILLVFGVFFIVIDRVSAKEGSSATVGTSPSPSPSSVVRDADYFNEVPFLSAQSWKVGAAIVTISTLNILVSCIVGCRQFLLMDKFAALEEEPHMCAQVVRRGRRVSVLREELVVGDLVEFRRGDIILVDGLLVKSHSLKIKDPLKHAVNNGESRRRSVGIRIAGARPDVSSSPVFLLCNSSVLAGYGLMLVTSVGSDSSWGVDTCGHKRITPLQRLVERCTTFTSVVKFASVSYLLDSFSLVYIQQLVRHHNRGDVFDLIKTIASQVYKMLSLVGSLLPADLSVAVAETVIYCMPRLMAECEALVRNVEACETNLGLVSSVCMGKSGVLTCNVLDVHWSWIGGVEYDEQKQDHSLDGISEDLLNLLFEAVVQIDSANVVELVWGSKQYSGEFVDEGASPVERALLTWGMKKGMQRFEVEREKFSISEVTMFNSDSKTSQVQLTRHCDRNRSIIHRKGVAETVLSSCCSWMDLASGEVQAMTPAKKQEIENAVRKMRQKGLSCVALAVGDGLHPATSQGLACKQEGISERQDLVLIAVVGLRGSCRRELKEAVQAVKAGHVKVRMVTGDNLVTAAAIAKECGILVPPTAEGSSSAAAHGGHDDDGDESVVDGPTFRSWTTSQMSAMLPRLTVLADATPDDKLMLVRALQEGMGEVVALTGDKAEDVLALEEAGVALSLGKSGTEATKQASDIVILGDSFVSIAGLLRWGRSMRCNLQHYLYFQFCIVTAIAVVSSTFSGVQLLWIELLTKLPIWALVRQRPLGSKLDEQPAPGRVLITAQMWYNVVFVAAFQMMIFQILLPDTDDVFAFNVFMFLQIGNVLNAHRLEMRNISRGVMKSPLVVATIVGMAAIQFLGGHFLRGFLFATPMHWRDWLRCLYYAFWVCFAACWGKTMIPQIDVAASTSYISPHGDSPNFLPV